MLPQLLGTQRIQTLELHAVPCDCFMRLVHHEFIMLHPCIVSAIIASIFSCVCRLKNAAASPSKRRKKRRKEEKESLQQ